MKNHHFPGKTRYFYGHVQWVCLFTRGYCLYIYIYIYSILYIYIYISLLCLSLHVLGNLLALLFIRYTVSCICDSKLWQCFVGCLMVTELLVVGLEHCMYVYIPFSWEECHPN